MAISLVQWGSLAGYERDAHWDPSTYTSTFATNPAEGNLLLLAMSIAGGGPTPLITFQLPEGWTQIATWDQMENGGEQGWYYRFATSGEGSVVEIADDEGPDNEYYVMFITEWEGIDGDDPFHDGATFTGSQVDAFVNEYTTSTLSGTRDMLYITWAQWERTMMAQNRATIGNGFATTLDGQYNQRRFIQADYIATVETPRAANWSWSSFAQKGNFAIVGFSGSSGVPPPPPPATFAAGQYAFDNTVFGGLVNFAVPLEEMPDFHPVGEEIRQDFHTSHIGKAWHYDWFRRPVHRIVFNAIGTDTAATLGSLVDQDYAFLFYDYVSDYATAGTGTYIFVGPYRRFDYGPDMCEFDFTITRAD